MSSKKALSIHTLTVKDVAAVADLIDSQSPEYLRFFYAFNSDKSALTELLTKAEKDVYSGVFWEDDLAGIFFLRGWDSGYEMPSFGVLIAEKYRGRAFLNLTVDVAKLICKMSGVNRFMVKKHSDNAPLANIQKMGFYQVGVEESTGNIIFHLDF